MRSRPLNKRPIDAISPAVANRSYARVDPDSESSDDEIDDEQIREYLRNKRNNRRKLDPHEVGVALRLSLDTGGPPTLTDAEYESHVAFCCKICHCSKAIKSRFEGKEYMQASAELIHWHRACCHNQEEQDETWASPYLCCLQEAQEQLFAEPCKLCQGPGDLCKFCRAEALEKKGIEAVDAQEVFLKYMDNNGLRKGSGGEDFYAVMNNRLHANPAYIAHLNKFRQKQAKARTKPQTQAIVVLDLFGGIGSAIVALKRLKIDIRKVVHVEHDKVANYVYKYWNCSEGGQHHDGIEHVFISSFEAFQRNLNQILEKHGPFDIVIGAPPYVHYSGEDASAKAMKKKQESYLMSTGLLVNDLLRYNKAQNYKLFYLVESTVIFHDREEEMGRTDLDQILNAFGIGWHVSLDSKDHTPLQRKRTYISNIPLVQPFDQLDPPARLCFDDGYDLVQSIFDPEKEEAKVPSLMATKPFLDDHPRMSVYKQHGSRQLKLYRRTPTVKERERLMGLPPGYVSQPVEKLFTTLVSKGFAPEAVEVNTHWFDCLPEEFHEFAGDYHGFKGRWPPFQFYTGDSNDPDPVPAVKLKLAPPVSDTKPQYFTEEQYAKRLIGNAFSIPTLEFLLSPITTFFGRRKYNFVQYDFSWARWDPSDEKSPTRSALVKSLIREVTRIHGDTKPKPSEIPKGNKPALPLANTISVANKESVDQYSMPKSEIQKGYKPTFSLAKTISVAKKESVERHSIPKSEIRNKKKPVAPRPSTVSVAVERRSMTPSVARNGNKLTALQASAIPVGSRKAVDRRKLPISGILKKTKPTVPRGSTVSFATEESVERRSMPTSDIRNTNKPTAPQASIESVERQSSPTSDIPTRNEPTASLPSTTPVAAWEPDERLSLPPASAMEEVDRRLLSGANEMDDNDGGYEDFDV